MVTRKQCIARGMVWRNEKCVRATGMRTTGEIKYLRIKGKTPLIADVSGVGTKLTKVFARRGIYSCPDIQSMEQLLEVRGVGKGLAKRILKFCKMPIPKDVPKKPAAKKHYTREETWEVWKKIPKDFRINWLINTQHYGLSKKEREKKAKEEYDNKEAMLGHFPAESVGMGAMMIDDAHIMALGRWSDMSSTFIGAWDCDDRKCKVSDFEDRLKVIDGDMNKTATNLLQNLCSGDYYADEYVKKLGIDCGTYMAFGNYGFEPFYEAYESLGGTKNKKLKFLVLKKKDNMPGFLVDTKNNLAIVIAPRIEGENGESGPFFLKETRQYGMDFWNKLKDPITKVPFLIHNKFQNKFDFELEKHDKYGYVPKLTDGVAIDDTKRVFGLGTPETIWKFTERFNVNYEKKKIPVKKDITYKTKPESRWDKPKTVYRRVHGVDGGLLFDAIAVLGGKSKVDFYIPSHLDKPHVLVTKDNKAAIVIAPKL